MNRDVIKCIKTCVALVVIVILLDVLFGQIMSFYSKRYGLPGDYAKIEYLFRQSQDDVLILGSSVAINSFMPAAMMDSLGVSIFNGGCNAQNLVFFRCVVDGALKHHQPRGIILVLQPDELAFDDMGRISLLNPYYGQSSLIDSTLALQNNGKAAFFLHSNLYRYNTVWFRILLQSFLPKEEMANYGFVAKHKPLLLPEFNDLGSRPDDRFVAPDKLQSLQAIIGQVQADDVELLVVIPPCYKRLMAGGNPYSKQLLKQVCQEHGVQVMDYSEMDYFWQRPELFYDNSHLNGEGANVFTQMFIGQILKSEFYQRVKNKSDESNKN